MSHDVKKEKAEPKIGPTTERVIRITKDLVTCLVSFENDGFEFACEVVEVFVAAIRRWGYIDHKTLDTGNNKVIEIRRKGIGGPITIHRSSTVEIEVEGPGMVTYAMMNWFNNFYNVVLMQQLGAKASKAQQGQPMPVLPMPDEVAQVAKTKTTPGGILLPDG